MGGRDGFEVRQSRVEANVLSAEGEEWLEDEIGEVIGEEIVSGTIEPLIEENGGRHGGVAEPGKRELAEAVVPVRMADPFNIERFAEIERKLELVLRDF